MRLEEKIVTPEQAKIWLENKVENRGISKGVVENYARQMLEGWWQDSPQTISFRIGDNRLIDGQHRLSAIVLINKPVKMNIIWDAPPHSFDILEKYLNLIRLKMKNWIKQNKNTVLAIASFIIGVVCVIIGILVSRGS